MFAFSVRWSWVAGCLLLARVVGAETPALAPDVRYIPGDPPTHQLRYTHPDATNVVIEGSWNRWAVPVPLEQDDTTWQLDTRLLHPPRAGRYEYKFIIDGSYEPGRNRVLHLDPDGMLDRIPDLVQDAILADSNRVEITFRSMDRDPKKLLVRLEPELPIRSSSYRKTTRDLAGSGCTLKGDYAMFLFDPARYGVELKEEDRVAVAGTFNAWDPSAEDGRWVLLPAPTEGQLQLVVRRDDLRPQGDDQDILFKFNINGDRWMEPLADAPNRVTDAEGNVNLRLSAAEGTGGTLVLHTEVPVDLSTGPGVVIEGLRERPIRHVVNPLPWLDEQASDKPLGAVLDARQQATIYRVFAPRATRVELHFFDGPVLVEDEQPVEPVERHALWKDPADGVWEVTLQGWDAGRYYAFRVDGPVGDGEGFHPGMPVGDPYARSVALAEQANIVVDPDADQPWFDGWTDDAWRTPPPEDAVIYEAHVRDLTAHASSGVPPDLRGTFAGLAATLGTGTGLDHLKTLGFNTIELLPVAEYNNGTNRYDWGYTTAYYFAPESSYGQAPLEGSAYYEFKHLVNELHRQGFAVVLDVVYNHVGSPNVFDVLDRKYYFRLNQDYTQSNFSGCGNDVRTEAPMMRRFIVDNVLYWMEEFHVDGFRFDLAELIDMETLMEVRDRARALNPNVLLISEPWSFRGNHKHALKGTGWSAWNDEFRNPVKAFLLGEDQRDAVKLAVAGSMHSWADDARQSVNYLESHDDFCLTDEFSFKEDKDGRSLTEQAAATHRLAATLLFTSLGIPMVGEGQEFLRSKHGIHNTYNAGDDINALDWEDRDRPLAKEVMAYYQALIALRSSPAGASLRLSDRPPEDYLNWIPAAQPLTLGYIVNGNRSRPGAAFVVLLNAGDEEEARFSVPLPVGTWRIIGDGRQVGSEIPAARRPVSGGQSPMIRVPPRTALILMSTTQ